jgi:hypothetical protein
VKTILRAAACAAALAWPGAALAIDDGNELYEACRSENNADASFCFGYIQGSMHTLQWWALQTDRCFYQIPDNVTNNQGRDVLLKHLRSHPENRSDPATMLVAAAIMNAWPCKE